MVRKILLVISILVLCGTLPILARDSVTFCAAGDVLLDRGIRMAIERQGIHYPFSGVSPVVSSYDLAFCNLESPISDRGDPLGKQFVFRGDPRSVESLLGSGFTIFSLANNHTLDYGRKALTDTISLLKKKGLFPLGAGKTQSDARQSLIIEKNGLRFAFIATVPMALEGIAYQENLPGPSQSHLDDLVFEIQQVRKSVDFIIVSFHWGLEYSPLPSLHQIEYAHGCIDAGADLVIGHHPHVIQSIEKYRGKIILYSVGNFVFDQPPGMGSDTFLFGCTFARGGIHSPHLLPVVIVRCRPELATGEDFKRIAREVQFVSEKYHVVFHQGKDRLEIADEE